MKEICFFIGDSNMRNKLSKFALAVGFVLALAFTLGCSSDSPSGPSGGYSSPSQNPSSSSAYTPPPPPSSSSEYIPPPPPPSSSSMPRERMFYGEIGTVCVGYANLFSTPLDNMYFIANGTDNYVDMYSVCGNKAQSSITGTQTEGVSWLNARNISDAMFNAINQELFIKGNSAFLGFYPAVDGYLRYLYIEELNDGKGLLKILAMEEK